MTNTKTTKIFKREITQTFRSILLSLICLVICAAILNAQNVEFTSGKADKNLKSVARVNPVTKAMEFNIPLTGYPGRGGNSMPVALNYSSKMWRMDAASSYRRRNPTTLEFEPVTVLQPQFGERSSSGWTSSLVAPRIEILFNEFFNIYGNASLPDAWGPNGPPPNQGCTGGLPSNCQVQSTETTCIRVIEDGPTSTQDCTRITTYWCGYTVTCIIRLDTLPLVDFRFITRVRVHMPDGSSHEFRKDDLLHPTPINNSDFVGTFLSVDGTGMRLEVGASGQSSTLYLPDGGRYLFSANETLPDADRFASEYVDAHGNRIQYT